MTTTQAQIATFPRDVIDRATEWVNEHVFIADGGSDATYDEEILRACQEIAALDAHADALDAAAEDALDGSDDAAIDEAVERIATLISHRVVCHNHAFAPKGR